MLRRLLILLVFALAACRTTLPQHDTIARQLKNAEGLGFDGQVVVMRGGRVIHDGAYGFANRETARRVTPDTTFAIASETKQFTATAILRLEADGKLRVEDTIERYLDGVPADKRDITIHQLLSHTSGLPQGDLVNDFDVITPEALVAKILSQPRKGTGAFHYSNAGYNLLAAIIERASGMPYARYLRTAIFDRIGLRHTGVYGIDHDRMGEGATAYRGFTPQGAVSSWPRNMRTWGGGDLYSTAEDLARFASALREGRIIPTASYAKMTTSHVKLEGGDAYGYAWFVSPELIEHGGDTEAGFSCAMRYYPAADVTLVLTSNRTEVNGQWLRWGVQDAIANLAMNKPAELLPDVSPAMLADGVYTSPDGARLQLRHVGGQLMAEALDPRAALALWNVTADAASLEKAVTKTKALLEDAKQGRVREAFTAGLFGDGAPFVDDYVAEWDSLVRAHGALRAYDVRGAIPMRRGAARAFVTLDFERGPATITYLWRDKGEGRIVGSSPGEGPPLARVLARDARGTLVAYEFGSKKVTEMTVGGEGITVGGVTFHH
jgi:CubicO group peptidase (beta-lactamase class C family)